MTSLRVTTKGGEVQQLRSALERKILDALLDLDFSVRYESPDAMVEGLGYMPDFLVSHPNLGSGVVEAKGYMHPADAFKCLEYPNLMNTELEYFIVLFEVESRDDMPKWPWIFRHGAWMPQDEIRDFYKKQRDWYMGGPVGLIDWIVLAGAEKR